MIVETSYAVNLLKKSATAGHRRTEEKRKKNLFFLCVLRCPAVAKK
jgi:hypothetical protein